MADRRSWEQAAACLCVVGLAAGGAQEPLARFGQWQAVRAMARLPGVSVAAMAREDGTGRLVLRDIGVARNGLRVSIGRLALARPPSALELVGAAEAQTADALAGAARAAGARIHADPSSPDRPAADGVDIPRPPGAPSAAAPPAEAAPAAPPPAVATAPAASTAAADPSVTVAEDVRIIVQGRVVRVPRLELRGTRLGAADLAALLDAGQPATLADRLSRFSAAVVRAPDVVVSRDGAASADADPAVTVHDLVLTGVVAGRIGSLAVGSVTGAEPAAAGVAHLRIGHIRADAVDLPLAAAILGDARSDPGTALQTVFASASVASVAVGQGGSDEFALAALRSGALRGRPRPRSLDRTLALASRPIASLDSDERRGLAEGMADIAGSYGLDHLEADDLTFRDAATPAVRFGLARFTLDGLGGDGDLSLSLDAAALDAPDAHLALDHAAFWGVDQGRLVGLARQVAGGAAGGVPPRPTRVAMALDGFAVAVPAKEGGGNADGGTRTRVAFPEVAATADRMGSGPVSSTAHLRLVAPLPDHFADPQLAGLGALGLTRIDVATDYEATYDPAAQRFSLGRFAVRAADLGGVTLAAVLDHVVADPSSFGTGEGAHSAGDVALQSVSLRFVNEGIVEKALPLLATSAAVSLPVFKASLKAQAAVLIAQIFGDSPTATQLNQAVSTFVDDPRSFTLTLTDPGGRTLAALQATPPDALARSLAVTAEADR